MRQRHISQRENATTSRRRQLHKLVNTMHSELPASDSIHVASRRSVILICASSFLFACKANLEPTPVELEIGVEICTLEGKRYTNAELQLAFKDLQRPVELRLKLVEGVQYQRVASILEILQSERIPLGIVGKEHFIK